MTPHPKELAHLKSTQRGGHHICALCKGNIKRRNDPLGNAVRWELKERRVRVAGKWRTEKYWTKAHQKCADAERGNRRRRELEKEAVI